MGQQISVRLSDTLLERLEAFAEKDHRTRSAAIQVLLEIALTGKSAKEIGVGYSQEAGTETTPSRGDSRPAPESTLDESPIEVPPVTVEIKPPPGDTRPAITNLEKAVEEALAQQDDAPPEPEEPCLFRNPMAPVEKCFLPAGHLGSHAFAQ